LSCIGNLANALNNACPLQELPVQCTALPFGLSADNLVRLLFSAGVFNLAAGLAALFVLLAPIISL
jgi:hypothetical protein